MLALTLAVGIVIDDAIVVMENIFRHAEMGKDRVKASSEGTKEITFAALAATLDNGGGKSAPLGRVMLSGTNQLVVLAPLVSVALETSTVSDVVSELVSSTIIVLPLDDGSTLVIDVLDVLATDGDGRIRSVHGFLDQVPG